VTPLFKGSKQERSEQANEVIEEYDNVTNLYGHKPTNEKILEMERHKGIVYQRKGKEEQPSLKITFLSLLLLQTLQLLLLI
jgi:hypothetical protein